MLTKDKIAGQYWPAWETMYPHQIPSGTNMLLLSFAVPTGPSHNGNLMWDGPYVLDYSTFVDSVQTTRAAGRSVLLSIGGAEIDYLMDNSTKVTNCVNSIKSIYNQLGGLDGIDWDVENQPTPTAQYVSASQQLKDFYGADFAISCSYAGNSDEAGSQTTYKAISQALEASGDLDMSTIQYYDYANPQTSDVQTRLGQLVNSWDVDPYHLGVGVKYVPGDGAAWQTTTAIINMWNTVEATYPTLRGCNNWESLYDHTSASNGFSNVVGPALTT